MSQKLPKTPPYLCVDELVIRTVEKEDCDKLLDYVTANREYLTPWEPARTESFFTLAACQQRITQHLLLQSHNLSFYFLIFEKNRATAEPENIVGIINYSNIFRFPFYACQLGYSLSETAQGKGIMRRALKATNQWMFESLNIHRIMAAYIPRNARSANVLKALDFVEEGRADQYLLINGNWEDHILTSLTNVNWQDGDNI